MIQNNIIERLKKDAIAQLQFEKIRKANEARIKEEQAVKPKLQAPKMSLAEVRFWETYEA
tara:strand:+ start:78 stop:257 length:180 start_codon:yes stop_codon:yes gene_type:complete